LAGWTGNNGTMTTRTQKFAGLVCWLGLAGALALPLSPASGQQIGTTGWAVSTTNQDAPPPLAREFRAAWVATVANIDWPSSRTLTPDQQRTEMLAILDKAREINLNAIVLQVRPACDAIYPSKLEPWSEFLTGQSGKLPVGAPADYDPLRDWIAEAHARGLELHAWFNPFRARHFESRRPDAPMHISNIHPELVKAYDQYLWLDPGEPEAQTHSLMVIADVVNRYDIDGVHFDDYFYPYPKDKQAFPDDANYLRYRAAAGPGAMSKADWRRSKVNTFVKSVYEQVKKSKPWVKVGISPFGIWRPGNPAVVKGFDQYDGLYADARLWLREGWVDYLAPQLYWKIEAPQQPYQRLLQWWLDQNDQRRHVWPGNYTSRILADKPPGAPSQSPAADGKPAPESWTAAELLNQIDITRKEASVSPGNIHFSMIALKQNRRGIADALRTGPYALPAMVPASPWLAADAPPPPRPVVKLQPHDAASVQVSWVPGVGVLPAALGSNPGPQPAAKARSAVYRVRRGSEWLVHEDADATDSRVIELRTTGGPLTGVAVTLIDQFGRESQTTVLVSK